GRGLDLRLIRCGLEPTRDVSNGRQLVHHQRLRAGDRRHSRDDLRSPAKTMTPRQALRLVAKHGVMLEAARGPVPNLADVVAGGRIRGSWWSHPRGREIFGVTRAVRNSPDILVARLVDDHITFVHRRLWPAVVRLAPRLRKARIARLREVHTT